MAITHYADLKAQGYRPGKLALIVVACGHNHKGVEPISMTRSRVTCPTCLEKLKDIPEAPPVAITPIRLRPPNAEERAATATAPATNGTPAVLHDGAPVTVVQQPPAPPQATPEPTSAEGEVTFEAPVPA